MTVRKNFVFDEEVAKHLEELAKREHKSQTAVIKDLIEEKISEYNRQEKLRIAQELAGSCSGCFGELSIQDIKADMDV